MESTKGTARPPNHEVIPRQPHDSEKESVGAVAVETPHSEVKGFLALLVLPRVVTGVEVGRRSRVLMA